MNLVSNTTTKNLLEFDDLVISEQYVELSKYTRTHAGGDSFELFTFKAASKGKTDMQMWVKKYLSDGKERLYVQALRNLFRKIDFIELNQSLEMEDISEKEYDKELEENEDKYLIPSPKEVPTVQQVIQVADIIKKLGREDKISVDEASELFSLEMGKAMDVLEDTQTK